MYNLFSKSSSIDFEKALMNAISFEFDNFKIHGWFIYMYIYIYIFYINYKIMTVQIHTQIINYRFLLKWKKKIRSTCFYVCWKIEIEICMGISARRAKRQKFWRIIFFFLNPIIKLKHNFNKTIKFRHAITSGLLLLSTGVQNILVTHSHVIEIIVGN